jgi:ssDNA-binding replication factor A large subunit
MSWVSSRTSERKLQLLTELATRYESAKGTRRVANVFNEMIKRELTIVDRSCTSVRLTLWNKQATSFDHSGEPVIAWKSVKIGDFGGM